MKFFSKTSARLLVLILILIAGHASAQNCNCSLATYTKMEQLRDEADTAAGYKLLRELKSSDNTVCQAYGYTLEMMLLISNRKMDTIPSLLKLEEKLKASGDCKTLMDGLLSLNYSRYYKRKDDYTSMSDYAFKALTAFESIKDKENELRAIKDIVYLFTRQSMDERIPEYLKRGEKIVNALPPSYLTAANFNWLAFEYEARYANVTKEPGLLDTALLYADKAIAAGKASNNYEAITQSFRVYEAVSYHRKDLKMAVASMDSALFYAKKIKVLTNLAPLFIAKSWDLSDLGEIKEAVRWTDSALYYVNRDFKGTPSAIGVYQEAAALYEAAGETEKSYAVFKIYDKTKDSLLNLQKTEKIAELEQKYNKTKNENTIRELAQQKRIYILLAAAGLFALIGLIFFIRQQSLKNKKKILETEQRLNRARMNPHFFFNALSSLQSYALDGNDGKSIASNLSKFSHIMRETLESTYKEYVTIEQEADFLREYLELQKIRFPQKFTYSIQMAESLEPDETVIPSMILQPFAENSIEHGFSGIDYPGHLDLLFNKEENELLITITDNGKGLASQPKESGGHISRASQIIKDRIYLLNIKLKTKASFSIANNTNEKGVTVVIRLPILYANDLKR